MSNNFALSDAEDKTSGSLNRGSISDLLLLKILLAIGQKTFLESDRLSCFIRICKFGSFKNIFATNNLLELYFRFRRLFQKIQDIFLVKHSVLSNVEDNISGFLNRGSIADLPLFQEHYYQFAKSRESQVSRKWWPLLFY